MTLVGVRSSWSQRDWWLDKSSEQDENSFSTNLIRHEMTALASHSTVKVVGANGQISLGKQFAGRQVLVEEREPGVWMVRTATVIPDNERWLHEPQAATDLRTALTWAAANPATDSNTDALMKRLSDGIE